jgi:hypothetical protein
MATCKYKLSDQLIAGLIDGGLPTCSPAGRGGPLPALSPGQDPQGALRPVGRRRDRRGRGPAAPPPPPPACCSAPQAQRLLDCLCY